MKRLQDLQRDADIRNGDVGAAGEAVTAAVTAYRRRPSPAAWQRIADAVRAMGRAERVAESRGMQSPEVRPDDGTTG